MRTSWLHEYGSIFGCVRWVAAMAVMPAFIALVILDAFVLGNPVSLSVILGFMAAGMVVAAIDTLARKGKVAQSEVDAGWDRAERLFSPTGYVCKIYKAHRRTFPMPLRQKGTIGTDINRRRKGQGRQGGRKRQGGSPAKKAASDDGPGPGEPPEPPLLPHLFLSFLDLALRWSCSAKTLRNQVAIGKLPRPVHLPVGPRFPVAVIQQIESGKWQIGTTDAKSDLTSPTVRKRGRPRIAQSKTLVTAMNGGDQ
ncbi:MAG: hypothetical protein ACYCY0_07335 [Acidithiobacillus ferrivorans]